MAVHHCPSHDGSTLWVGRDLACRCRQVEDSLVGGVSCWNKETGAQGWGWRKVAGPRSDSRIHWRKLRAERGRYEHLCRKCYKSPLDALQKNAKSNFLSWRRLKKSSRPATSASSGNWLEMQILRPHPTCGIRLSSCGASSSGFQKTLRRFLCLWMSQNHGLTSPTSLFHRQDSNAQGPATWIVTKWKNRIPDFKILVQNLIYFRVWFLFHGSINFQRIWI